MTERIRIEVEPWIMEDGNYGDFHVGDDAWFALEFQGRLKRCDPAAPRLHPRGAATYDVTARTVLRTEKLWIIDFGVQAYCDIVVPDGIQAGEWVAGEIHLGIDPFGFRDQHALHAEVPEAIYRWNIAGIQELTAPSPPRAVYRTFEETPWTVREVAATDAWNTRPGYDTTYLMDCERRKEAPVRRVD